MDENRLRLIGETWTAVLDQRTWPKENIDFRKSLASLQIDDLPPREIHRLLVQIRDNQFFRSQTPSLYRKYSSLIHDAVNALGKLLNAHRKTVQVLQKHYLAKQEINLEPAEALSCELENSRFRESINQILDKYAYEVSSLQFDKSCLLPFLEETAIVLHRDFGPSYLAILKADLVAAADAPSAKDVCDVIPRVIQGFIAEGHDERDLLRVGQAMLVPDHTTGPDDRFKVALSNLRISKQTFVTIAILEDVAVTVETHVSIGNVVLHKRYDTSKIISGLETTPTDPRKEFVKDAMKPFAGKVVAEVRTSSFGQEEALERANYEFARAIDILSLENPNVVVREPGEQKNPRFVVFDEKMTPVFFSSAQRIELYQRQLNEEDIEHLDQISKSISQTIVKDVESRTELQARTLVAWHFYRKGNYAFDPLDKVVNYIVGLESLLVMKGEHPSTTLPRRVVEMLWVNEDYAPQTRKTVENAYRHRSEIVHRGIVNPNESNEVSKVLRGVNFRLFGVILNYVERPDCEKLQQLLAILASEAVAERERVLKSAFLEINREYKGKGVLKDSSGEEIGEAEFGVMCRDDGHYAYILGSVTSFKLTGKLEASKRCIIEGFLEGFVTRVRLELSHSFDPWSLWELISQGKRVSFQAKSISEL